jgi:tRNA(Ile)-lysidine synthase TilS/MesJ
MALAYLCSKIRPTNQWFKVVDHPVSSPFGVIVNHDLREGSAEEADNVAVVTRKLGVKSHVVKIRWDEVLPEGTSPKDVPNIETLARYLRYRRLGTFCKLGQMATLFTAHHEDDQYETVMMRLLSGHGHRGLLGMRPAVDIPECYDLHGVYQSGFVDDQRSRDPFYNIAPNDRERRMLKRGLRNEVDPAVIAREIEAGLRTDLGTAYLDDYDGIATGSKRTPRLAPLEFEDGGVMVYRPLLHFSKDQLIATCLENNIPWFEDHTNADRTLTLRNAVRYMRQNHKLPVALQKPAILRLAERCQKRVASAEAEADRLLDRVLVHEFGPNTGTSVVSLPQFSFPTAPRRSSASLAARQRRVDHYRHIAALLIRRLLTMVTPERDLSQPAQLAHLVSMLFPSLADPSSTPPPPPPKPYVICSVLFTPLLNPAYPPRWLLSRAPHASNVPRPEAIFHELSFGRRLGRPPSAWKTTGWSIPRAFDGRFWIRLLHRLPCRIRVAPFEVEHYKPFREALAGDKERKELAAMLRRYAPGKTRYTLPAIYATIDVTQLLKGGGWWPGQSQGSGTGAGQGQVLDQRHNRNRRLSQVSAIERDREAETGETEPVEQTKPKKLSGVYAEWWEWERDLKSDEQLQLLALPTLGVCLPGLDDWLRWEVRYRKVDYELLRLSKLGGRRIGRRELRERVRCSYRWMKLGRETRPLGRRWRKMKESSIVNQ